MGRKRVEINYDKLDALLQFKVTKAFCADYLEISEDTLERRLKDDKNMTFTEYHKLKMQRTAVKLQQKAIEQAMAGNAALMIFSLKNIANWSDKIETQVDSSIQIEITKEDAGL